MKALQYHPDKNPDPVRCPPYLCSLSQDAHEIFKKLGKIYAVLSCPLKRRDYDDFGEDAEDDIDSEEIEEVDEDEGLTIEQIQACLASIGSLISKLSVQCTLSLQTLPHWPRILSSRTKWARLPFIRKIFFSRLLLVQKRRRWRIWTSLESPSKPFLKRFLPLHLSNLWYDR